MGRTGKCLVQAGLTIRPSRIHRVHTCILRGVLPSSTRTRWRLGFHRRFVRLCAWLIRWPYIGPLPQISHRCAISRFSSGPSHYHVFRPVQPRFPTACLRGPEAVQYTRRVRSAQTAEPSCTTPPSAPTARFPRNGWVRGHVPSREVWVHTDRRGASI